MIIQLNSKLSSEDLILGLCYPVLELICIFTLSFFISRAIRDKLSISKATCDQQPASQSLNKAQSLYRGKVSISDRIISMCAHKFEQALDLYNSSKASGSPADGSSLDRQTRALCVGAIRASKPQLVFSLIRDLQSTGSQISNDLVSSVIKSCTARLYHKECLALYDHVFNRATLDDATLSCLLFSAVEAGENWRARKLFKEISSPTTVDSGNYIRACCARSDLGTALQLYDTISEPDPYIVALLATVLTRCERFEEVEGLLGRDGGRLTAAGANEVLSELAIAKLTAQCAELLRNSRNFELTDSTFAVLIPLFRADLSLLGLIYNRGSCRAKTLGITSLVSDGFMSSALPFIEAMLRSNELFADQRALESLILALADRGEMVTANHLIEAMISKGSKPNGSILTSLLLCCKSTGCEWSTTQSIFTRFSSIGVDAPSEALEVLADLLPIDEALVNELCDTMNE